MNKNIDIGTGMKIFAGTMFGKKDFAGIFIAVSADIEEANLKEDQEQNDIPRWNNGVHCVFPAPALFCEIFCDEKQLIDTERTSK